jgi:nitrous oxidase accessory protein
MVAWYSHDNIYRGNEGRRSRYSIHFMFANDNIVEGNRFYDNAVGVYFMYTEGGACAQQPDLATPPAPPAWRSASRRPRTPSSRATRSSTAPSASAPTSRPSSPTPPSAFRGNRFAYNGIAIQFTSELGGNVVADNTFEGNLTHVAQAGRGKRRPQRVARQLLGRLPGLRPRRDGVGDTPTSSTPTPTASGWRSRRRASSRPRRCWNCSISSSAWRPSPRPT